jgi:hypothetical protein
MNPQMAARKASDPRPLDSRTHLRLHYVAPASLWIAGNVYEGELRNISDGGLRFFTENGPGPETEVKNWKLGRAKFDLPHFPSPLQLNVRICWVAGQTKLLIGCQYLTALPKAAIYVLHELRLRQLLRGP